eukprot:1415017-Pyramimonas_sp.AAC.1
MAFKTTQERPSRTPKRPKEALNAASDGLDRARHAARRPKKLSEAPRSPREAAGRPNAKEAPKRPPGSGQEAPRMTQKVPGRSQSFSSSSFSLPLLAPEWALLGDCAISSEPSAIASSSAASLRVFKNASLFHCQPCHKASTSLP